jgi:putative membrane protein
VFAHRALAAFGLGYYALLLGVGAATGNASTPVYAAFMAVLFALGILADLRVRFGRGVLWGLAAWGLLHMCGGLVPVGGDRVLYEVWLLPVVRFDHVVHAIGFGFAGLACWQAARRSAPGAFGGPAAIPVVVLGGCGLGALNELVEFLISQAVAGTRVGGYENTGWDLLANLVGCLVAALWAASRTGRGEAAGDQAG